MTAVVAIINHKEDILIGKKKTSSGKFLAGEWHIPGETAKGNETDKQALIRGMKEETGLDIIVGRLIGKSITPTSKSEARWYECFAETEKAVAGSDLERVAWVYRKNVPYMVSRKSLSLWPEEVFDYFEK